MIDAHIELPQSEKSLGLLEDALEFSGVNEVIAVQRDACESVKQSCLKLAKQFR